MPRLALFLACLVAAFGLFYAATKTPAPLSATAPAADFSAARAMADIASMAPVPHPVGSPAAARVRDYLMGRMTALGLSPAVRHVESHREETFGGETYVEGATVENVVGVLPGRDHALPALLLMAHSDSVPGSPGAADDSAGVATALEIVRALKAGGTPRRDVIVAITDGEEAGLLGANAFFASDPLAARVGFVINMDVRGGGGRAAMFETGADNGQAIDLFARTARRPAANSLSAFVYKLLPNDTDFSIAKAKGLPGLNYAFIGRQFDYHSPSATAAALDQGAVQHMGDEVLGTARALAMAADLPQRAPDKVYADLLGWTVIAYPASAGWLILVAAGVLIGLGAWRASRAEGLRPLDLAKGAGAVLILIPLAAGALIATRLMTGADFGFMAQRPLLARFAYFEAAMTASALGALLLVAGLIAGGRARLSGVWTGLLITALALGGALQAFTPVIAFLFAWPLLAAATASALTAAGAARGAAWMAAGAISVVATAWLGVFLHLIQQGLDQPAAPALLVWLASLCLWPLAWPDARSARRFAPGLLMVAIGLAIALTLRLTSPWTARHPAATEPLYVIAPRTGLAWKADAQALTPWSRTWLTAQGASPKPLVVPGFASPVMAVPAPAAPAPEPSISVQRHTDGQFTVRVMPAPGAAETRVDLWSNTLLMDVKVNGGPVRLAAAGRPTHFIWSATDGYWVSFRPVGPGVLTLHWAQVLPRWPATASPPPAMPATVIPWGLAGSTAVVGAQGVKL